MRASKRAVQRWAAGHRAAAKKIAAETRRHPMPFSSALERVDDLRTFAGPPRGDRGAAKENLQFHETWAKVRRAFRVG